MVAASSASGMKLSCSPQVGIFKLFSWRDKELLLHCLRKKDEHDLGTGSTGPGIKREKLRTII